MYGQIIMLLVVLMILYYAGMITMDIIASKKAKASEDAAAEETEIDISDLADSFEPVEIRRPNTQAAKEPRKVSSGKFKEPLMTNGLPIDNLIVKAHKKADSGGMSDDLAELVHKCEAA